MTVTFEYILRDIAGTLNQHHSNGWSSLRRDVIHETLHEYQYKVQQTPSPAGQALYAARRRNFSGKGHNAVWYSAIAAWAHHFNLSGLEMEDDL